MIKFKHNKKRNTAFLYEALILELTKSILKNDLDRKKSIVKLIKERFSYGTTLHQDLKLYHSLSNTKNINPKTAEKILLEVKRLRTGLDKKKLLSEQNELTRNIKKILDGDVLTNFVPNYKSLATISQIFNQRAPVKTRMLLEADIIGRMSAKPSEIENQKMVPMDNLVYKTFVKKFNKEYDNNLLKEQKELLNKFISSFSDNGLELKLYLNEEVGRLKTVLKKSLLIEEFVADEDMQKKAKDVISVLESYKDTKPDKDMVQQVVKIQGLVQEIHNANA